MPTRVGKTRNAQRARYYAKHREHAFNTYKRWTPEDEEAVAEHAICDVDLSRSIGRSVSAIQIKRCRMSSER